MGAIGKWIITIVLGWLFDLIKGLVEKWAERQRKAKERDEDNKKAEEKLEEAKSEEEVIEAGSELLKR